IEGLVVKAGSTVVLPAVMQGIPTPTPKWQSEGNELKTEGKFKIITEGNSTVLTISECVRTDSGEYGLTVANPAGSKSVALHVTVLDVPSAPVGPINILEVTPDHMIIQWRAPKDDGGTPLMNYIVEKKDVKKELTETVLAKDILVPPDVTVDVACRDLLTVRAGQIINLVTRVKGRPDPEITWTKDARALGRDKRTEMNNNFPLVELVIQEAVRADYGKYAIQAKNSSGQAQATIIVNVLDIPGACQNLKVAYVTKDSCMVSWENPEDNGGTEITNYIIECRQPSQRGWTVVSSDCTKLQTKNEGGESNWVTTAEVLVKEELVQPELKVKLAGVLVVKAGDAVPIEAELIGKPQPDVKWSKEGDTADITKSPRVQVETGTNFTKFLLTNSRRGDTGKYIITATNTAGTCSAEAKVNVLDRPGPIRDLKVSDISMDRCKLTWEIPEDDGGCDIYNYIIEKCETKRGVWSIHSAAIITNSAKVTRLIEGNEYIFRVRAENKMGAGPAVETESIVARTQFSRPGAPDAPEVTKITKDEMVVMWCSPDNDGGKPITGYILEKKEEHAIRWAPVVKSPIAGTQMTVTGLLPNHEYQFRVRAENEIGVGDASKPSRSFTLVCIYSKICFNLKVADSSKTSITLAWTKPTYDGGAPLIGYVVELRVKGTGKKGDEGWKRCNVAAQLIGTEFTVSSLDEKLEYEFRVSAQNQVGLSQPTNLGEAVTPREVLGEFP
uniref:Titin n=1 Tax=Cyprinus carpio TaxID=7962 RepID=A0A8C1GZC2_CYPCA